MTKTGKMLVAGIIIIILGILLYITNRSVVVAPAPIVIEQPTSTVPEGKLPAGSTPPVGAATIQGQTWVWDKTIMNDGAIITPKKAGAFTLSLGTDGKAGGKTDCNGYFASYQIGTDGVIKFDNMGSTMMFCEGSQEAVFTGELGQANHYMTDATGNLVLLLPYDSGSILFKK